jgi:hypothetical protein
VVAAVPLSVGDLVLCRYNLDYHYTYAYPSVSAQNIPYYMGIILSYDLRTLFYDRDLVYEILCTDGERRFFTRWEVEIFQSK